MINIYRRGSKTEFLGLQIDNHVNWENHMDQFQSEVEHVMQLDLCWISATLTLSKSIYFAYFYSLMKYGIIFGGNSCDSKKVFTLKRQIVRIVMGVKSRNSCRDLFKRIEILTLPCEYVFY
jgi:hypothetical protein